MTASSLLRFSALVHRIAPAILAMTIASCSDDGANPTDSTPGGKDAVLRANQLQAKGTHNSYHIAPPDTPIAAWRYTHATLDEQFQSQGVRAVELDTQYNATLDAFDCFHFPGVDELTTCRLVSDCLAAMKSWSDQHARHHLIFVQIEPKDSPPAGDPEPYFTKLESEILRTWPRDRIVTPGDVQGQAATLREAIIANGWPTLGATRGKILLFVDNSTEFRTAYTHGDRDLNGRLMFIDSDLDSPYAGVLILNDPGTEVQAAVSQGFIVRTRADGDSVEPLAGDTSRRDAALSSGAQIVSTDYPVPTEGLSYSVTIPQGTPSRCNPVIGPADCKSEDIENPRALAP